MTQFRGSFTVMVTPFREDGRGIDEAATRRFVDWQIREGVPGLIPLGSTGEFLSVADDERTQLIETLVDQARGRVPIVVGTAAEWTDVAVRYSREAERLGAAGVMVVPPFYSSPTEDELFEHYRRIAEAISIPIMVYNNPNTSNVDLRPQFVARLGELDAVRYIKESSGDISRVREIARLTGGGVTCFAGYHAYDSMVLGGRRIRLGVRKHRAEALRRCLPPDGDGGQSRRRPGGVPPPAAAPRCHRRRPLRIRHPGGDGDGGNARGQSAPAPPAPPRGAERRDARGARGPGGPGRQGGLRVGGDDRSPAPRRRAIEVFT